MCKFIFSLTLLTAGPAQAYFLPVTECQAASKTHTLKMQELQDDVLVSLDNAKEYPWGRLESERKSKFKVSGKTVTSTRVHNIRLAELRTFKATANLVATMMFSRTEFAGDSDLVYSYSHNLVYNLTCK